MSTIHTKFIDPYRLPPKGRFCLNCDPTDWNKFKLFSGAPADRQTMVSILLKRTLNALEQLGTNYDPEQFRLLIGGLSIVLGSTDGANSYPAPETSHRDDRHGSASLVLDAQAAPAESTGVGKSHEGGSTTLPQANRKPKGERKIRRD